MPSMMKAPHSKGASCKMCGGGACKMAEGGEVKGVHGPSDVLPRGQSEAGYSARQGKSHPSDDKYQRRDNAENIKEAKGEHYRVLGEITSMKGKDRTNLAEGGEVEPDADDMELSHGLGKELMGAFESKDHKKLMSSLEACVLHCMSKSDPEEE